LYLNTFNFHTIKKSLTLSVKKLRMKKLILALTYCFFASGVIAQHEADKWYFGVNSGVDFTTGSPMVLTDGMIVTNEGCASVSDAFGALLFYTDGITVWNSVHQVMPNGTGLMGGISSTQSALVVPKPGSSGAYYIFTLDEIGGANGFRYSIVDMSLQGGLGDITAVKNVPVQNNVTERITAIKQDQSINYWIVVHEWGSNAFYAYQLSAAGLSANPVISNVGIVHNNSAIQNTYGQMKFSPCGDKIGVAVGYLDTVEIFDFNNLTGVISNPISIPMGDHVYGLEFSRTGKKLYVSRYGGSTLIQFDLISGIQSTIINSMTVISTTPDIYGMQLAVDGKIYVCKSFSQFLGVINQPEFSGLNCNYVDNAIDLDPTFVGHTSALSLPGFVQSFMRTEISCVPNSIDENLFENISIYPNPSAGNFTINYSTPPEQIDVYDITGKLMKSLPINQGNKPSFGEELQAGLYILKFYSAEKEIRKTIIKY
jgi:hypothetical protein